MVSSVVYFWSWLNVRFYARGFRDYVESSFTLTVIYLTIAPFIMLTLGLAVSRTIGWGFRFFTLGSILVVFDSLYVFLRDVAVSIQPYYVGYVNVVRDSFRFLLSVIAVYVLNAGLTGALVALISSSIVADTLFLLIGFKHGVRFRLNLRYIGYVFRNIYIPIVNSMYQLIASFEKPLVTFLSSSTEYTAYLNVASVPKSIIVYGSGVFTQSLLPKLLSSPSSRDVEDTLRIGFLINNGLAVFMLVFANALLSLYGVSYVEAKSLFVLYVLDSIVFTYALILSSIPIGLEKRDLVESGLKLLNSYLFKIPFAMFIRSTVAILIGSVGLIVSLKTGYGGLTPLVFYPIGWLITDISFLVVISKTAKKCLDIKTPWRELYVTLIASIVSATTLYATGSHELTIGRLTKDLPKLIKPTLLGGVTYLTTCLSLSKHYREIAIKVIKEKITKHNPPHHTQHQPK